MRAAIISFSGANGILELEEALEKFTDFTVDIVDDQTQDLSLYDYLFLPGGASYGDYLRPGAIAAQTPVIEALKKASETQRIIGFGNGFQILCEAGLLPGGFLMNESLNFHESFLPVEFQGQTLELPVSAKFGQYILTNEISEDQIVMRYQEVSPFGKQAEKVAGVVSADGRVLGIFPHPERACQSWQQSQDGAEIFAWLQAEATRKEGKR